jgi:hypothetical protein
MSIERPSKSFGTAVRKPASSPGVRHLDVATPRQMVPGVLYCAGLCKNESRGLVIAIAPAPAGSKPASAEADGQVVLKCPHCGNENLYRWSTRGEYRYAARDAAP